MKYPSIAIFFLLITILSSCSGNEKIKDNETVRKVFSIEEAEGLEEIYIFFTNQICTFTGESDPIDAFKKYMASIKEKTPVTGSYPYLFNKKEQDKLYAGLDSKLFSEIWHKNESTYENNVKAEIIGLNIQGKYVDFLFELGKEYQVIKDYHTELLYMGVLSASSVAQVMLFPEKYNIDDSRIRLVIAIHYLTTCYQK